MAHSADTFRGRAAVYKAMMRCITDERALEILDELAAENVAKAGDLEALAVSRPSFMLSLDTCNSSQ